MQKELEKDPEANQELLKTFKQLFQPKEVQSFDTVKFIQILKEVGRKWREKRIWEQLGVTHACLADRFRTLFDKAAKDSSIPDAELILNSYHTKFLKQTQEAKSEGNLECKHEAEHGRKHWSREDNEKFHRLITEAGSDWMRLRIWEQIETKTEKQFTDKYRYVHRQAKKDQNYPDRKVILSSFYARNHSMDYRQTKRGTYAKINRWTPEEHEKFIEVVQKLGQNWRKDAHWSFFDRSEQDIRQYFRQYYLKCLKDPTLPAAKFFIENYYANYNHPSSMRSNWKQEEQEYILKKEQEGKANVNGQHEKSQDANETQETQISGEIGSPTSI